MKVSASAFLQGKKPALKELLDKLLSEYEYASILGQDSVAKNYTVSAGGTNASQDNVLTKRGFIVRVMDKNGYGEYSFSDIDESAIDSICISIREGIDQLPSRKRVFPQMKRPRLPQPANMNCIHLSLAIRK